MRFQSTLAIALVAGTAASFGAYGAADDKAIPQGESATAQQPAAPMMDMKGEADKKDMMSAPTPTKETPKRAATPDRTKHFHPRDGK